MIAFCRKEGGKDAEDREREYFLSLSRSKRRSITRLLPPDVKYEALLERPLIKAFDGLLRFPGLWSGFELGNIPRHLALNFIIPLVNYLERMFKIWDKFTLGNLAIAAKVCIPTVKLLELRAPSMSLMDRSAISRDMDNRSLFPGLLDPELRSLVRTDILNLQVIIPTIKSFHENIKYFEIGASIMKSHLLRRDQRHTLYDSLKWTQPEELQIEVEENVFEKVVVSGRVGRVSRPGRESEERENSTKEFCFKELFNYGLCDFTKLSDFSPRKDPGHDGKHGSVDGAYKFLFLQRAKRLGFTTPEIDRGLAEPQDEEFSQEQPTLLRSEGESLRRRWGRPFSLAYEEIRSQPFLRKQRAQNPGEIPLNPSVLDVQRDFMDAFLGTFAFDDIHVPGTMASLNQILEPVCYLEEGQMFFESGSNSPHSDIPQYGSEQSTVLGTSSPTSEYSVSSISSEPREQLISPRMEELSTRLSGTAMEPQGAQVGSAGNPTTGVEESFSEDSTSEMDVDKTLKTTSQRDHARSTLGVLASRSEEGPGLTTLGTVKRRPFLTEEAPDDLTLEISSIHPPSTSSSEPLFNFFEHNGMLHSRVVKSRSEMQYYLEKRQRWIGLIVQNGVPKSVRHDQIILHMDALSNGQLFFIVKYSYVEQFCRKEVKIKRSIEDKDDVLFGKRLRK